MLRRNYLYPCDQIKLSDVIVSNSAKFFFLTKNSINEMQSKARCTVNADKKITAQFSKFKVLENFSNTEMSIFLRHREDTWFLLEKVRREAQVKSLRLFYKHHWNLIMKISRHFFRRNFNLRKMCDAGKEVDWVL